jgi:hypothetical protein
MNGAEVVAAHEAAHCCAALLLNLPVLSASVEPDENTTGRVRVLYQDTAEDAHKRMSVILAGLVESGEAPEWPLGNCTTDETNLREITDRLGLDRRGYDKAVREALDLTTSQPYERLRAVIADLLERHGRLDQQALGASKPLRRDRQWNTRPRRQPPPPRTRESSRRSSQHGTVTATTTSFNAAPSQSESNSGARSGG